MKHPLSLSTLFNRRTSAYICDSCHHERQLHASVRAGARERPHRRTPAVRTSATAQDKYTPVEPSVSSRYQQDQWTENDRPRARPSGRDERSANHSKLTNPVQGRRPTRDSSAHTGQRYAAQPEHSLPKPIIPPRPSTPKQASSRSSNNTPARRPRTTAAPPAPAPSATTSDFSALHGIASPIASHNAFTVYTLGTAPSAAQLSYANRFFTTSTPSFLFGSAKFRALPPSSLPEVAFLGRSNVGKSSLLNALLHRTGVKVAHVSGKPGRTRQMNAFGVGGDAAAGGGVRVIKTRLEAKRGEGMGREVERWVGRGGLVVLDMPGYGKASREIWGREIVKYLKGRKQLRRAFILIDAEHGPKRTDMQLLALLRTHSISYTIVLSKIDKLLLPGSSSSAATLAKQLQKLPEICRRTRQQLERDDDKNEEYGDDGEALGVAMSKKRQAGAAAAMALTADVLTCSAEKAWPVGGPRKMGVENLRWAVLGAAGLDCDENGHRRVMQVDVERWEEEDGIVSRVVDDDETAAPGRINYM